jgi:hypothetical protein
MCRFVEWLFMLQNRQLIRWGRSGGRVMISVGVCAVAVALGGTWFMEARMKPVVAKTRELDRKRIASIATIENLREHSLRSQERYASAEGELLRLVGGSFILMASTGLISLSHGLLYLRARKLALAVEQGKSAEGQC